MIQIGISCGIIYYMPQMQLLFISCNTGRYIPILNSVVQCLLESLNTTRKTYTIQLSAALYSVLVSIKVFVIASLKRNKACQITDTGKKNVSKQSHLENGDCRPEDIVEMFSVAFAPLVMFYDHLALAFSGDTF